MFQDGSRHLFAYDQEANGLGRLTSITEQDPSQQLTGQTVYTYDIKGRVISEARTIGSTTYTTTYIYDGSGRLSGMTYPSGRSVIYGFDAFGRVNQIVSTQGTQSQVLVQNVQYQPFGGVKSYTFGNGQIYSRGYDTDGRIASYSLGSSQFALGYDAASRIVFISDVGNPANSNTYGYDNLDRLTSAVLPSTPFAYSYDAVGNRLSKTTGSGTDTYSYSGTSNQLASTTPASGPARNYIHDPDGSITADGLNAYTYDARGRMVQSLGALGSTTYQVNALGQRVRKTNSNDDRIFLYDSSGRLISEAASTGVVLAEYFYLADVPIAVVANGNISYIHVDHLNTPRLVADATGTTVWRWDQQEPFGVNVPDENPSGLGAFALPLRESNYYADKETGNHYAMLRDCYDPATARFCQSDPIGLAGGISTYSFVDSDPLGSSDPDGLQKRGGGNPRPGAMPGQSATWLGEQGSWYRGQFYPRLASIPVAPTPRTTETYCPAPGTAYPSLPRDLPSTLDRITSGQVFPHRNDGSVFRNDQGLLPQQSTGYYREYVHPTVGAIGVGAQRVVTGQGGEIYYSPNHYQSFIRVNP